MDSNNYKPKIFHTGKGQDLTALDELKNSKHVPVVLDFYQNQQRELLKINSPRNVLSDSQLTDRLKAINKGTDLANAGCWVYYSWKNTLVHLIDPDDFIKIRTARNLYKITPEEQDKLKHCKVGIIGLSVGHSVALNLALERSVGELRLADFDTLELSNINRIKTSILNIGLPKVVVAAREIAEIDPFIKVKCFTDGVNETNLNQFLLEGGSLNALVEECDSLNIKILARTKAKELGIPVLMETSDRGMLDVERFDLEPYRPILHGFIEHLDLSLVKDLKSSEEKIPYLMPMVGIDTMSTRLKASALEVGQSIGTWPQIASSVMLGSAVLSDTYRKIMLGDDIVSGRYIVDPADSIKTTEQKSMKPAAKKSKPALTLNAMKEIIKELSLESKEALPLEIQETIIKAAGKAPSGGNSQPWKWLSSNGYLHLFFDASRSESFMDYKSTASLIALGTSIENAAIKALAMGYKAIVQFFPINDQRALVASICFIRSEVAQENLAEQINHRYTDRGLANDEVITTRELSSLKDVCAEFPSIQTEVIIDAQIKNEIAQIVSSGDWLRIMNYDSHHDFIVEEMRWSEEELQKKQDGIFVEELNLSSADLAGLHLIKDKKVIEFMNERKAGQGLKSISSNLVNSAQVLLYGFSDDFEKHSFIEAGMLLERLWLNCTEMKIGFQILNVPLAFILRAKNDDLGNMSPYFIEEIKKMTGKLDLIFDDYYSKHDLFIVRIFKTKLGQPTSLRKDLKDIFIRE